MDSSIIPIPNKNSKNFKLSSPSKNKTHYFSKNFQKKPTITHKHKYLHNKNLKEKKMKLKKCPSQTQIFKILLSESRLKKDFPTKQLSTFLA